MTHYVWYAVGAESKRHVIYRQQANPLDGENWMLKRGDPDGWIPWEGGECPLPPLAKCYVRDEYAPEEDGNQYRAEDVVWGGAMGTTITGYRPILDTKPEAPEWDGGGLPPVGCECEMNTRDDWVRATIVFSDGDIAIGRIHDGQNTPSKCDWSRKGFRPIRSEEDKAVKEMVRIMNDWSSDKARASALHRAGYRKT